MGGKEEICNGTEKSAFDGVTNSADFCKTTVLACHTYRVT